MRRSAGQVSKDIRVRPLQARGSSRFTKSQGPEEWESWKCQDLLGVCGARRCVWLESTGTQGACCSVQAGFGGGGGRQEPGVNSKDGVGKVV